MVNGVGMYEEETLRPRRDWAVHENQTGWTPPPIDRAGSASECRRLCDEAAFTLWRRSPVSSAGEPLRWPWDMLLAPVILVLGFSLLDYRLGLVTLSSLLLGALLTIAGFRLLASFSPVKAPSPPQLGYLNLPTMSVLVPLYREAGVVADLARSLSRLDYPKDRLEIIFLLEIGDHETLAAARAISAQHRIRIEPVWQIGPKTKPKALNYGLIRSNGDLIAIYDAEDAPHPGQLRAAANALVADPKLGCVQAPLGWYNRKENWLTRQFAVEYATQFHAILPFLSQRRWPLPLGGTSNVFRRTAVQDVGGWDPFNVTEDADLGFRLARAGWTMSVIEPGTLEEAPVTLKAWTAQRSRWLKGHLISWAVQMRKPAGLRKGGGPRALPSLHLTLGLNVLSAICHAPTILICSGLIIWLIHSNQMTAALWPLATLLLGYLTAMAAGWNSALRAGFRPSLFDLLTMPVYWLLQLPAMIRALCELHSQPYLWAKTEHGVSRKPRRSPDEP